MGNIEIKIEDYLHLHLGCEVYDTNPKDERFRRYILSAKELGYYEHRLQTIKPILRPLSDMTEEERNEIFKIVFKRPFPESGKIDYYPIKTAYLNPRHVLWSGVDRLGIDSSGQVWADCDLSPYKYNQHEITLYLLSKHFDLFGLIPAGLAIDKTNIKN